MTDLQARLRAALGDAYQVERELGGGGMSRVFLATEASLHRAVVIKLLPPEFASEVSEARFKQEIELAAHLQHPNILPVLSAGAKGGRTCTRWQSWATRCWRGFRPLRGRRRRRSSRRISQRRRSR